MQRLILFGGVSILLLSAAILPNLSRVTGSTQKETLTTNEDTSHIVLAQNQRTSKMLSAVADDGTPQSVTQEKWLDATSEVSVSPVQSGNYTVTLEASNLVPNGLYTFWWVNKKLVGMDMGPAGGTPGNEFRADNTGNATATITVPANNNYQILAAAYHADNQTHGQMPGEMGKVTFTHLMGNFPKPN